MKNRKRLLATLLTLCIMASFVFTGTAFAADEAEAEVNKLEEQGYTYGYTEKQVQRAKESYEYKLERIIKSGDENE